MGFRAGATAPGSSKEGTTEEMEEVPGLHAIPCTHRPTRLLISWLLFCDLVFRRWLETPLIQAEISVFLLQKEARDGRFLSGEFSSFWAHVLCHFPIN